jgi:hypothetical protein
MAFQKWKKQLDKILFRKEIIHPFKITEPVITDEHIRLLKEWASVGTSVRASVRASVGDSVGDSVGASVRASVGDSVRAYYGSFFILPRHDWKYTENVNTEEYPFQCLVTLWEHGLVPSFDGKTWRLHAGENAKILWEGTLEK